MAGLTQAQINAKKTAINGHLDQRGCQSWNNAFGFNNKPGNYVPTLVIDQTTGAIGTSRRAAQQLPAAGRAGLRPGDQPERHALRRRRPRRPRSGARPHGIAPGSVRARQTRDNVGIQYGLKRAAAPARSRAEEFVTLNEKIGGFDADCEPPAGAQHRRPARRSTSPIAPASSRAARTSASCRSSTRAAGTSRASTTSGAASPSARASTRPTAATTATR